MSGACSAARDRAAHSSPGVSRSERGIDESIPNPKAPAPAEAIQEALAPAEAERYTVYKQPQVEGTCGTRRSAFALTGLPEQLIHRDCHHGNIVVDGERVSGFVDCDHLSIGPRIFDLADFIVHMIKHHVSHRQRTEEWFTLYPAVLEGYEGENPLSEKEKQALYATMLGVLLMFAAWFYETGQAGKAPAELAALAWMVEQRERICDHIGAL